MLSNSISCFYVFIYLTCFIQGWNLLQGTPPLAKDGAKCSYLHVFVQQGKYIVFCLTKNPVINLIHVNLTVGTDEALILDYVYDCFHQCY